MTQATPPSKARRRYFEITGALRKSTAHEAKLIVEVLEILIDEARTKLVQAHEADMLRLQGEARAFIRVHRELTNQSPSQEQM